MEQDEIPFHVRRLFRDDSFEIEIFGDQLCFGEDYVSLKEAREGMEWIVNQLGGKVKWNKRKKK